MKKLFPVIMLGLLSTCSAAPAFAQNFEDCGPRQEIVESLYNNWGETPVVTGLAGDNSTILLEVYANLETTSFTVLATAADGQACLVASGVNFFMQTPVLGDPT